MAIKYRLRMLFEKASEEFCSLDLAGKIRDFHLVLVNDGQNVSCVGLENQVLNELYFTKCHHMRPYSWNRPMELKFIR